jgi:hypothetical protein
VTRRTTVKRAVLASGGGGMRAESPERLAPSDVRSPFTGRFGSAVCPVPALGGCSAHASLNLRTPKHRHRCQVRVGAHKLGAVTFKTV